jgi:hypothetical protein
MLTGAGLPLDDGTYPNVTRWLFLDNFMPIVALIDP